jgi:hypothetical protein
MIQGTMQECIKYSEGQEMNYFELNRTWNKSISN